MHEVLGCGIDVEELIRFRTKIPEPDVTPGFAKIVYTPDEISQIQRGLVLPERKHLRKSVTAKFLRPRPALKPVKRAVPIDPQIMKIIRVHMKAFNG